MKRLNMASLKVGDIILSTRTHAVSKAIRIATNSDISHAMVYVDNGCIIDATAVGVQAHNIQRLFFEDECTIYVLRASQGLLDGELLAICNFVRAKVGTQYSTWEAISCGLGHSIRCSTKQFCSRLVAQAFASAGHNLVQEPDSCTPADIKNSPLLIEVQDVTMPVTAEEMASWEGLTDTPQQMRCAINVFLDSVRSTSKTIQTLNDVNQHLIEHPEDDARFTELLHESGYLSIWQGEVEKHPWRYDLKLMSTSPEPSIEEYCTGVLTSHVPGPHRFVVNRGGFMLLARQFGLKYFETMKDLYEGLANLHQTQVEVVMSWLEAKHGLAPVITSPCLRPHTPEWFAALEIWDPPKAEMTRQVVKCFGSVEVCSICGDNPARDYRLEEAQRPAGGVDTMRLCEDCLGIRRAVGEVFEPLPED